MAVILDVDPNNNPEVTRGADRAVAPFRFAGGPTRRCRQLDAGPFGIESEADVEAVVPLLVERVGAEPADARVIARCADPGLTECRAATAAPILGIRESAVATVLTRTERFGVAAVLESVVPRHLRVLARIGVLDRSVAAQRPALRPPVPGRSGRALGLPRRDVP